MVASLTSVTLVTGVPSAIVFAMIFGINNGVTMTFFGFLWPRYFGRKHLGSIQGIGQMVGIVGASIGALPYAIASDINWDIDFALRMFAILPLACAGIALFLRDPIQSPARR